MQGFKIRKNAVVRADSEIANTVLEFKKYRYDSWKLVHNYGKMWAAGVSFRPLRGSSANCKGYFD